MYRLRLSFQCICLSITEMMHTNHIEDPCPNLSHRQALKCTT